MKTKTPPSSLATRPRRRKSIGEIAGETAAECTAVCCCFPCGLLGLVICAAVKLPAGLCRRLYLKGRRRRLMHKSAAEWGSKSSAELGSRCGYDGDDVDAMDWGIPALVKSPEVAEMEREMMQRFYATGFWRSPSQREDR